MSRKPKHHVPVDTGINIANAELLRAVNVLIGLTEKMVDNQQKLLAAINQIKERVK